eukprot:Unigene11017_Nuclearia_a/m.33684 Unigene11017_Nuclearia_a/g.33684  ORF Unigene11017_Nuclearia_a/g.33684 Unigene11017_Nuclearia_a/m.33684 type:complete len:341 (+) Unigene11017_Nuclearia_a:466-1488(+)
MHGLQRKLLVLIKLDQQHRVVVVLAHGLGLVVEAPRGERADEVVQRLALDADVGREDVVADLERHGRDLHPALEEQQGQGRAELAHVDDDLGALGHNDHAAADARRRQLLLVTRLPERVGLGVLVLAHGHGRLVPDQQLKRRNLALDRLEVALLLDRLVVERKVAAHGVARVAGAVDLGRPQQLQRRVVQNKVLGPHVKHEAVLHGGRGRANDHVWLAEQAKVLVELLRVKGDVGVVGVVHGGRFGHGTRDRLVGVGEDRGQLAVVEFAGRGHLGGRVVRLALALVARAHRDAGRAARRAQRRCGRLPHLLKHRVLLARVVWEPAEEVRQRLRVGDDARC